MKQSFTPRRTLVIGGVVMFVLMVSFVIAMSALNFTKHSGPVLSYGEAGKWDDFNVYDPSVLYDGLEYKMWYVATSYANSYYPSYGYAYGYATSPDGINWTRHPVNPVFNGASGGWDTHLTWLDVVKVNGEYLMYYTGAVDAITATSKIGLATSPDGIHWTKYNGNPIITIGGSGDWDDRYVGRPSVIYKDGVFHMWYAGDSYASPRHKIGYLTSTDGIHWIRYAPYPVLVYNTSFQQDYISSPEVVWDGTRYVMFYAGSKSAGSRSSTWVAYSADGINWQQETEPVITTENQVEWDYNRDISPGGAIIQDGKYKYWYFAVPGNSRHEIGYSEASLGKRTIVIDIKPGSNDNPINLKSNGVIPVAILTTDDFDATTVDPFTVEFGPNSAMETHHQGHIEDAEGDGDLDLILHFKTQETGIQCGTTEASLVGKTFGGMSIVGIDAIQTIGCSLPKSMAAEEKVGFPEGYALSQNYPNPFNPATEIRFQLPEANHVVVKIFNTLGHEIRTLVDAPYEAGYHNIRWDGKDRNGNPLSTGIYLYQLQAGYFRQIKTMSLLR